MPSTARREFVLSDQDFRFIAAEIHRRAGIVLHEHKRDMVYGRLVRRVRELGLPSFRAYCEHLQTPEGVDEVGFMINAITTNLTAFFREAHHFETMRTVALPEIVARGREVGRRLRLWSAACSSGEEPYSMAMTLLGSGVDLRGWDVRILATDLDTDMLARATRGVYAAEALAKVPLELRRRFTEPAQDDKRADAVTIKPAVRQLVTFRQLNLLDKWPMRGPFDIVFCRNVLIYFDAETKARVIRGLNDILRPGGWLCLGHSESLLSGSHDLKLVGHTVYRRAA